MSACERLRPVLFRIAEGEATPDEALLAGRHLPTCTACRILLARERRLAEMLEGLQDPVPVASDDFVGSVMRSLPDEPPAARPRRLLKLVGVAGAVGALGLLAARLATPALEAGSRLALPDLDAGGRLVEGLAGIARVAWMALAHAGGTSLGVNVQTGLTGVLCAALVPVTAATLAASSAALVYLARSRG